MTDMTMCEADNALKRIPPPSDLVRVNEAAALTGHNPETLRRRIRRGELRAWGFPRRVLLEDVLLPFRPELACNGAK